MQPNQSKMSKSKEHMLTNWKTLWAILLFPPQIQSHLGWEMAFRGVFRVAALA